MISSLLIHVLFLAVAGTWAEDSCSVVRDVDVIFEVPQKGSANAGGDYYAATIDGPFFLESLAGHAALGRCWRARATIIDRGASRLNDFDCLTPECIGKVWTRGDSNNPPRKTVFKELERINKTNGGTLRSTSNPAAVVLLLSDEDSDLKEISDAAVDLQEVGYKFITIGIGNSWVSGSFSDIAAKPDREFIVTDIGQLLPENETTINNKLKVLLSDPEKTFPKTAQYSSSLGHATQSICKADVDLGFILDSSGSLKDDYYKEKQFIQKIAREFDVKKDGTHVGVVTFSDRAKLSIKLSETTNYDNFHEAVLRIPHMDSITRLDLALKMARDELFQIGNGGRVDKKKVLVVLTDGSQTYDKNAANDIVDPGPIARDLRNSNVELLVIGIGQKVVEDELKGIAGPKDNYRTADTFEELSSRKFAVNMTTKLCDIVTSDECEKIVDICFLIDASGSIDESTSWIKIKEFARRLANVFKFSENGARGSVVVFSDHNTKKKNYTKVAITLREGMVAGDFGKKVEDIPYIGFRTRIDLGFNLIENHVFTAQHGARPPSVKKVIVLITDGRQNPPKYDPVAASQKMYESGVSIYAIGIGRRINWDQLNDITRRPHRVFRAETFNSLENTDFVNSVSSTVCRNTTTPEPETSSCCCPSLDDTFKENLGIKLVEKVQEELNEYCNSNNCQSGGNTKEAAEDATGTPAAVGEGWVAPGVPAVAARKKRSIAGVWSQWHGSTSPRKKRSVTPDDWSVRGPPSTEDVDKDFAKLGILGKISKAAGCNMFLNALRKFGILDTISTLMKDGKHVAIFCPVDDAYAKLDIRAGLAANERNLLLNHIGLKSDTHGRVYHTLLDGRQILFNPTGREAENLSWKANGVDVIVSLTDGIRSKIVVTKDIILSTTHGMLDTLKSNENVSIFYELVQKSELSEIFKMPEIERVCFTKDMCLSVTPSMKDHLKNSINLNQFTICAPTNDMFINMKKATLKSIMSDPKARREFLREYVFLGSLGKPGSHNKDLSYSLSQKHFILSKQMKKNLKMLKHANGLNFKVQSSIPITEGMLHVVDMVE